MEIEIERLRVKNFRKRIIFNSGNVKNVEWLKKMDVKMIKKYFRLKRLWTNRIGIFLTMCFSYFLDFEFVNEIARWCEIECISVSICRMNGNFCPFVSVDYKNTVSSFAFHGKNLDCTDESFRNAFWEYCKKNRMIYNEKFMNWTKNYF